MARWAGRKKGAHKVPVSALSGLVLALVLAGVAVGGVWACREFCFDRNPRFMLRHLDIEAGETLSASVVREYLGLSEGMNCFDMDIERVRSDFLSKAPNISDLSISRRLPDTIRVHIIERAPLARLERGGVIAADSDGWVFVRRRGLGELPVIAGVPSVDCKPGARLSGMSRAALQFLDLCDAPVYGLRVNEVQVGHPDYIVVRLMDQREIRVAWLGMGTSSSEAGRRLDSKLADIAAMLRTPRAAGDRYFDATLSGNMFGRS